MIAKNAVAESRAASAYFAARSDFWEAGHYVKSSRERSRRDAKARASRALRRAGREICRAAF